MLVSCKHCRKMISSYREKCPHCLWKCEEKKKETIFWRFSNVISWSESMFSLPMFYNEKKTK